MQTKEFNNPARSGVRVYRISKGWKIFISIGAPLLALGGGGLMLAPFWFDNPLQLGFTIFFLLLGGGFCLLAILGFIDTFKTRVEIYPDRIKKVAIFKTQELPIEEIAGFKHQSGEGGGRAAALLLLPKERLQKVMSISLILERNDEIIAWVQANLSDLDALEQQEEMEKARHDPALGDTGEERFLALGLARLGAKFLNGLAIIVALWALFWPQPYKLVIWALILLPWVTVWTVRFFRGALKFDGTANGVYPNVAYAVFAPSGVLALRALLDWSIIDAGKLWLLCLVGTFVLFSLGIFLYKEKKIKPATIIGIFFMCAIYGYGALVSLNGLMDESTPLVYEAEVFDKRISSGDLTSYYLKLAPWGEKVENEEVDVGEEVYRRYEAGDTARVYVKKGRFGISWFVVD